ncbi:MULTISPECIES: porin [unclassified Burkholderia]|uniref:porin n=1 Tax=unclassified Burkholderia TaxID=2613784 RepID=UPI00214F75E6|nr:MULTISPECIES: porin [unclassified Burkholderia]MCR4471841.1 porin [Burkholderia sp. SCN-KJ]
MTRLASRTVTIRPVRRAAALRWRLRFTPRLKTGLRTAGVVALACAGHAAHAQSTLVMYGIVDAALQYGRFDSTIGATASAASGNLQASRFGLLGKEDLGGGYRANFRLETGFNTYTGVGGGTTEFNRGASVGLSGPFGSVDAGYLYLPIYWVFLASDVGTYGLANPAAIMSLEHTTTLGSSGTGGFYRNAIRYRTPDTLGAWSSEIGYSFGAQDPVGQTLSGRNIGANVQYAKNGLLVGYGFNRYQYYASASAPDASSQLTHVLTAAYDFGRVVVGGNYVHSKRTDGTGWFASAALLNARMRIGLGDVNVGVSRRIENGDARAIACDVGYVYYLSKRTQLYGFATTILNNRHSTQGFALLSSTAAKVTPGFDPWAVTAGVRTSF